MDADIVIHIGIEELPVEHRRACESIADACAGLSPSDAANILLSIAAGIVISAGLTGAAEAFAAIIKDKLECECCVPSDPSTRS